MKNNLKILLVEDDPDDVEFLETAFQEKGIPSEFYVISQGDKVLTYLAACETLPDVLLLDLNIPKVHGKEILKSIKASPKHQLLPVIILTTSSAKSDIDYCLATGAHHYFTKPTKLADFQKIIDAVVQTVK